MQKKYIILENYISGKISRKVASIMLGVTERTVINLKNKFIAGGSDELIHKNTERVPANKTEKSKAKQIIYLYKNKFNGFNFNHFYDYILSNKELDFFIGISTVKSILKNANINPPNAYKKKIKAKHPLRDRRKYFGELIQMDASTHRWFGLDKPKSNFYIAIDDSTSQIIAAHFDKQETLIGYYHLLKEILLTQGKPECFYTDKRTVFEYKAGKKKTNENVQFKRVCKSIGTELITTSVPQAKGRVERSFKTHQSRLLIVYSSILNELKLNRVSSIDEANSYLKKYIATHNKRFALPIDKEKNIFKKFSKTIDTNYLLTEKKKELY